MDWEPRAEHDTQETSSSVVIFRQSIVERQIGPYMEPRQGYNARREFTLRRAPSVLPLTGDVRTR